MAATGELPDLALLAPEAPAELIAGVAHAGCPPIRTTAGSAAAFALDLRHACRPEPVRLPTAGVPDDELGRTGRGPRTELTHQVPGQRPRPRPSRGRPGRAPAWRPVAADRRGVPARRRRAPSRRGARRSRQAGRGGLGRASCAGAADRAGTGVAAAAAASAVSRRPPPAADHEAGGPGQPPAEWRGRVDGPTGAAPRRSTTGWPALLDERLRRRAAPLLAADPGSSPRSLADAGEALRGSGPRSPEVDGCSRLDGDRVTPTWSTTCRPTRWWPRGPDGAGPARRPGRRPGRGRADRPRPHAGRLADQRGADAVVRVSRRLSAARSAEARSGWVSVPGSLQPAGIARCPASTPDPGDLAQGQPQRRRGHGQQGRPVHRAAQLRGELRVRHRLGSGQVDRAGDVGGQQVPDGVDLVGAG